MRRIEPTGALRKDFKREKRGPHRRAIDFLVSVVLSLLAEDKPLSEKHRGTVSLDHGMTIGNVT
ncbi:MAG: hypothetical protein ABSF59_12160 [Candidatus Sulfotelmatobacter sp.]|jgi:mRNA interferase YafQ